MAAGTAVPITTGLLAAVAVRVLAADTVGVTPVKLLTFSLAVALPALSANPFPTKPSVRALLLLTAGDPPATAALRSYEFVMFPY